MDLGQLREFVVLAEHLNFSEAAKQLYIAQPVLSRHIADLEQQLGTQLFIRTKHSVQLTAIGHLLLDESRILLSRYEETLQKIQLAASGLTGSLKIGFLAAPVKKTLAPFAMHFNQIHPNIRLEFIGFDFAGDLFQSLRNNEIDMGFTLSMGSSAVTGLSWRAIFSDEYSAVVNNKHPLAGKSQIDLKELAHDTFITFTRDQYPEAFDHGLQLCQSRGFSPTIAQRASQIETALMLVEMGRGVMILPRHTRIYANPSICYIDLTGDDIRFDVIVAWKATNSNPAILPFIKEVEAATDSFFK
jgi:DNA-binding transcriptional LysR family regulator